MYISPRGYRKLISTVKGLKFPSKDYFFVKRKKLKKRLIFERITKLFPQDTNRAALIEIE